MTTEGPQQDSAAERFHRRAAAAEINGRQVNEAIEPRGRPEQSAVFVCECGHLGCSETVEIAGSDAVEAWFLILNGVVIVPAALLLILRWLGRAWDEREVGPSTAAPRRVGPHHVEGASADKEAVGA